MDVMDLLLMGTNGNFLKLEEMSTLTVISSKHVFPTSPDVSLVDVLHISRYQGGKVSQAA